VLLFICQNPQGLCQVRKQSNRQLSSSLLAESSYLADLECIRFNTAAAVSISWEVRSWGTGIGPLVLLDTSEMIQRVFAFGTTADRACNDQTLSQT
jgi:hypothetical protein